MNMHDQEPSVSDILSSIRQILSDKIETETNGVENSQGRVTNPVEGANSQSNVSDEEVFVLTSQMRVSDEKMIQNIHGMQSTVSSEGLEKSSFGQSSYPSAPPPAAFGIHNTMSLSQVEAHPDKMDNSPVQDIDIKPMVQAWLDKNLPQMVEKIVSEEVRRIFNKR